jgi:hypothetical protein
LVTTNYWLLKSHQTKNSNDALGENQLKEQICQKSKIAKE